MRGLGRGLRWPAGEASDELPWWRGDPPRFEPVRILDVELGDRLPAVPAQLPSGELHQHALALARLHSRPLGLVTVELGEHGLDPSELAERFWSALGSEVNEHLARDLLPPAPELSGGGISHPSTPLCIEARDRALAEAPFASIVIPTRDRASILATCLDSLLEVEYPSYEIIVVDNFPSNAETAELIAQRYAERSSLRYVRQDGPVSDARNRGLWEAEGTVVAFTDDDVIVDRWWLLELVRGFAADRVACVTGMILPAELETPSQAWLEQYGGFTKGFHNRLFDIHDNRPDTPLFPYAAGMFGSGASMAFRRDVLRQLGGFDPATGPGTRARGGEDLGAFFEVIAKGHTLAYAPAAVLHHRHRKDYESLRAQAYSYGVGLGAFLTKTVVDKPARMLDVARRLPHGLAYMLSPRSEKNVNKGPDYPRELSWLEAKGLLYGPVAYLRARRESREASSSG